MSVHVKFSLNGFEFDLRRAPTELADMKKTNRKANGSNRLSITADKNQHKVTIKGINSC